MTEARVYADATALIGLARIGQLGLLSLLPTPICVTTVVWQEVAADATKRGVQALLEAREAGLLQVVQEGDADDLPDLDRGEASVLSAAAKSQATVLIDERKARTLVATHPALRGSISHAFGIVGLILLAKRSGKIPAVQPLLDALVNEGFWMSHEFRQLVLRRAGEM